MFSKYVNVGGTDTTVLGFAATDHSSGEDYPEPIDISFRLGDTSSKVLLSLNLFDAKQLARAIGSAIQHVETEAKVAACMAKVAPVGEQS